MKKGLIIFTAVCAIITGITLASCSNMLEDLRKAGKKNKDNRTEYTEDLLETVPDGSKKTNRVKITVDTGDKEIEKTGYVFSEPVAEKDWKNAEEVLTDSSFTEITKDSDGKYIITATENGEYTVAVKDKDGNKKYETVKVENIIPVNVDIPEVSITKKGKPVDVTVTGLNIDSDDFDPDAFSVVCTDSSGNEVTAVTDGAGITRNGDGSVKVTLKVPENKGKYEITIESNTKEYGDVYLNGTLNVDIIYYNVQFDTDGGGTVDAQKVEEGTNAQNPGDLEKTGDGSLYAFQGWYNGETKYNFDTPVNADLKLKAKWNETLDLAYYEKLVVLDENHIQFGAWPQTIMERGVEINEKDSPSCTQGMFTYYKGTKNNGKSSAGWYVKLYGMNPYNLKYSDGSAVDRSDKYFKLEPIKWRVLTYNYNGTGKALLLAENILYSMAYYNGGNDPRAVSDNNYEHSQVRAFLNGYTYTLNTEENTEWKNNGFLQTAFTQTAAGNIETTTVINNARSTNPASDSNGTNQYASNTPTNDKIFLLSLQEVTNKNYGFNENYNTSAKDGNRTLKVTDFAKANRVRASSDFGYKDNGEWWLRSPSYGGNNTANTIDIDGASPSFAQYVSSYRGIVPALTIDLTAYSYIVTFDSDGGSEMAQQAVLKGGKVQKTDDPIKTIGDDNLYEFQGWYNGETEYNFDTPVNADITIKAKWNKITLVSGYEGDIIEFGSWPQSELTDVTSITFTDSDRNRTYDGKYKEYLGSDNQYYVKVGDWYYKVEPIKWRVIATYSDGRKLLLADKIYSGIPYYGTRSNRDLNGTTIYPNNYKYSNIRAYLNSTRNQFEIDGGSPTEYDVDWAGKGFLTSAFTDGELAKIKTTAVDNSAATTENVTNKYECGNTKDKVFLLSYQEAQKQLYGLSNNSSRIRRGTDYASVHGAFGYWWLRSPNCAVSSIAHCVYIDGNSNYYYVDNLIVGFVPALTVTE